MRNKLSYFLGLLVLFVILGSAESISQAAAQSTAITRGSSSDYYSYPTSERILSYDSTVIINPDSSLLVTERIFVSSTNVQIRHGIFRDFPTVYINSLGLRSTVPFNIVSVVKDGVDEPYFTESIPAGTRIYIGDKDQIIPPGYYEYEIIYTTGRQLGYFSGHDELYYNITGNFWDFPIDYVHALVILPEKFNDDQIKTTAYTGKLNETGSDFESSIKTAGGRTAVEFTTTSTLYSGEGLSVVVGWPKGHVSEPASFQRVMYFVTDNLALLLSISGVSALIFAYLLLWFFRGRDPKTGTIIPLYYPPKDVSPSLARFVMKMGFDDKAVGADLLELGVKGAITITEKNDKYTLDVKNSNIEKLGLTESEKLLFRELFSLSTDSSVSALNLNFNKVSVKFTDSGIVITKDGKDTTIAHLTPKEKSLINKFNKDHKRQITIGGSYNPKVADAIKKLEEKITKEYGANYIVNNTKILIFGILFSFFIVFLAIVFTGSDIETVFAGVMVMVFIGFWELIWGSALFSLFRNGVKAVFGRSTSNVAAAGCLVILIPLGFIIFIVPLLAVFGFLGDSEVAFPIFILVESIVLVLLNIVFANAIKVRTLAGRQLEDKLEGFKMFMLTAEKNRIKVLYPEFPNKLDVFERFLPFAVAFNIEAQWADKFAEEISVAQKEETGGYHPVWYMGGNYLHFGSHAGSISSGISSSLRASATAPGSSSGFGGGGGGGGGSGGGGGGGGGGGW